MKQRDAKHHLPTYDFPERSVVDRRPRTEEQEEEGGGGPSRDLSRPLLYLSLTSPRLAAKRRGRNLNFTN